MLGAGTAVLFGFLHLIAFILVFGLGASLVSGSTALELNAAVAQLVAPLLALYAALARWAPSESTTAAVGLQPVAGSRWRALQVFFFAIVLGVVLAPLAAEITARIFQALPMPPLDPEELRELLKHEPMGPGTVLVLFTCLVVLVPLAEETLYRGFLQRRLVVRGQTRAGSWRAVLLIAVIYSAVQVNPRFAPGAFLLALGLALAARSGGSTWTSVAAHMAHRATPVALTFFIGGHLPGESLVPEDLFLPWQVSAACAGIAALAAMALWRLRERSALT